MIGRPLHQWMACHYDSKKHQPFWLVLFVFTKRCCARFFSPWDFIRDSLAFSPVVVYNKSSECRCISV